MTPATTTDPYCPLWRRLFALFYDLFAVLAIVATVGLVCELATHGQLITTGTHIHIAWWYQPLQGLMVAAYFLVSWLRGGQTLGMRPWRIRIATSNGARLTLRQALVRLLAAALPLLLLWLAPIWGLRAALWVLAAVWVMWFATALLDSRHRTVHDLIAGCELRRIA